MECVSRGSVILKWRYDQSMNTRLILTIALLSGLVGGLVSHYAFPVAAFAQQTPSPTAPVPNEIRAQSFVIVDAQNNAIGTIAASNRFVQLTPRGQEPTIVILDRQGHEVWRATGATIRQLTDH
jgi:hypothetical protein